MMPDARRSQRLNYLLLCRICQLILPPSIIALLQRKHSKIRRKVEKWRGHLDAWVVPQVFDGRDEGRVERGHSLVVYGPNQITLFLNFFREFFMFCFGIISQLD